MNQSSTSQKFAMGFLGISALALIVGVYNAATAHHTKATPQSPEAGSSFSTLISSGGLKRDHLMLVNISGMITEDAPEGGFFQNDSMAVNAKKALEKAAKDDSVKGVLIRVNSPGGTVGMSQELNAAVRRLVEKQPDYIPKPVVVSMGDMAASGGYYLSCAADKIVANPGTLTASIGVIISSMNLKGLLTDKLGVKAVTIKSGKFKDILSPYREPAPAELNLIQAMINQSYQQFLHAVIDGRTRYITDPAQKAAMANRIKAVADGRVMIGADAKKAGLVDELGDMTVARKLLSNMAKERFHIGGKGELPLEEADNNFKWLDVMGMDSRTHFPTTHNQLLGGLVPFSMNHPNQPLWVME